MAVTLPRINPIQSSGPSANPRINVKVQSQAGAILKKTAGVSSLVKTGAAIQEKYEDDTINQISNDLGRKYKAWDNEQLQKLAKISPDIDPTKAYNEYDIAKSKKHEELLGQYSGLSGRVRSNVEGNLAKTQESYENRGLKQRGLQQNVYKNNLHVATLKLNRENLADDAANVTASGKSNFDTTLRNISTEIAKNGQDNSTVERLPDDAKSWDYDYPGPDNKMVKVKLTNVAKLKIAQQQGEGIAFSIKSAIDSGQLNQAKIVYDKYKDRLDTKNKNEITKKFGKENIRTEAVKKVSEIERLPINEQTAAINNIENDELRNKARGILVTNNSQRARMEAQKHASNGDTYLDRMEVLRKAGKLNGIEDLDKDPTLRALASGKNLSHKFKKSLEQEFKTSKQSGVSEPKAVDKMMNLFYGNDPNFKIETMPYSKFSEYLLGINNKAERKKYTNDFKKLKTVTPSEERATLNRAGKLLEEQLIAGEFLEKEDGFITADSEIDFIKAKTAMFDFYTEYSAAGPLRDEELRGFIKSYSKAVIDDKVKTWSVPTRIGGPTKNIGDFKLDRAAIFRLKKLYKEENDEPPLTNSTEFYNFVKANKARL